MPSNQKVIARRVSLSRTPALPVLNISAQGLMLRRRRHLPPDSGHDLKFWLRCRVNKTVWNSGLNKKEKGIPR